MFVRFRKCLSLMFRLIRTFFQIMYGAWRISGIPGPYVSIFGGARFKQNDKYAQMAHDFAQMLVSSDISVLTGGGPGIMQAASCGAITKETNAKSIGIGVSDLPFESKNDCVQIHFKLKYFFARKFLLTRYSDGFVIFPGGFGTLDEMAEIITLIYTKHLRKVPIVLIGKEYWDPFMQWIKVEAMKHGAIMEEDILLFTITDDLHEAFCLIKKECSNVK